MIVSMPHEHRVRSGDVSLAVYRQGDPGKPAVVLVHGYPDSHTVWDRIVERLVSRYYVITYDVRGAGASDAPERIADYKLEKLAGDLKAVADAACPDRKFHLVAHDWGSIQSWEAATAPEMQDRIASFTTISGPCLDHAGHWMRRRFLRPTARHLAQLFRQLLHSWYIYVFHLPLLAPMIWKHFAASRWPALLKRLEGVDAEPSATRAKDGDHAVKLYRANIFPRLFFPRERRATMPVQAIVPLQDGYVLPGFTDDLHLWTKRLWRRDVASGHWLPLAYPDLLVQQVSEFVDFVESGMEPAALQRARVNPPQNTR